MEIVQMSSFWRDLKELVDYFDETLAESRAVRFVDAVDETIDFIEEFPDLGRPWESKRSNRDNLRVRLVLGFENYIVLYRRIAQTVYIMRVVDARRNLEELL
jgi:plasmid stabilization system protein ParE